MFFNENNKKVTIITPCYNGEDYMIPHIEGILNVEYKNLEYIFVNDGSTDNTENIILSYKDKFKEKNIKFTYLKQENKGQAAAINLGLQKMRGTYFSCIDADDILLPNFISEMSSYLEQHPEISICFPKAEVVKDKTYEHIEFRFREIPQNAIDDFFEDMILHYNVPFFPSFMLRTKDFLKIYPNRKIYEGKSGQNPQLILPFAYKRKVGYLDKCLLKSVRRKHSDSMELSLEEKVIKYKNWEDLYCSVLKYIPQMEDYEKSYYYNKSKSKFGKLRQDVIEEIKKKKG